MKITKKQRLLSFTDSEKLGKLNVCYSPIRLFIASIFNQVLENKYIVAIKVTYADKSHKIFDLPNWMAFRDGILTNLYKKGLCKIKFITYHKPYGNKAEFEKKFGKIDPKVLAVAEKISKRFKKRNVQTH